MGHIIGNCQRVETPKTRNHSTAVRGTIYVHTVRGLRGSVQERQGVQRGQGWSERGGVSRRLRLRTRARLNTHALQLYGDGFPTLWRSEQRQPTTFVPKHHPGRKVGTTTPPANSTVSTKKKKKGLFYRPSSSLNTPTQHPCGTKQGGTEDEQGETEKT